MRAATPSEQGETQRCAINKHDCGDQPTTWASRRKPPLATSVSNADSTQAVGPSSPALPSPVAITATAHPISHARAHRSAASSSSSLPLSHAVSDSCVLRVTDETRRCRTLLNLATLRPGFARPCLRSWRRAFAGAAPTASEPRSAASTASSVFPGCRRSDAAVGPSAGLGCAGCVGCGAGSVRAALSSLCG